MHIFSINNILEVQLYTNYGYSTLNKMMTTLRLEETNDLANTTNTEIVLFSMIKSYFLLQATYSRTLYRGLYNVKRRIKRYFWWDWIFNPLEIVNTVSVQGNQSVINSLIYQTIIHSRIGTLRTWGSSRTFRGLGHYRCSVCRVRSDNRLYALWSPFIAGDWRWNRLVLWAMHSARSMYYGVFQGSWSNKNWNFNKLTSDNPNKMFEIFWFQSQGEYRYWPYLCPIHLFPSFIVNIELV